MRRRATLAVSAILAVLAGLAVGSPSVAAAGWSSAESFSWSRTNTTEYQKLEADASITTLSTGLPVGCTAAVTPATTATSAGTVTATTTASANCNGEYRVSMVGRMERRTRSCCLLGQPGPWSPWQPHTTTQHRTVTVAEPAPQVTGLAATRDGGAVVLTWADSQADAPDITGFRVLRRVGTTADWSEVGIAPHNTYRDDSPPAGDPSYQVIAQRTGVADGPASAVATASSDPTPGGDGGGDGGSGDGGSGGSGGGSGGGDGGGPTGSGGDGGSGGSGGGSVVTIPRDRGNRVVIRPPRIGTPSNAFFPPLLSPPRASEVDTGFEGELPYGDVEPGTEDPVLPDDELASSPLEEAASKGLAIPVATALVLAVWAFHLRYLARASRPVYVDDDDLS